MDRNELFKKMQEDLADEDRDSLIWLLVDLKLAADSLASELYAFSGLVPDEPEDVIE